MSRRRIVVVFGVFDGIHEGHRSFLREAKSCGDYLIAVIPQDYIVQELKGRPPKFNIAERLEHLKKEDSVDAVIVGDSDLGRWDVLDIHRPDVIALGYDQLALKEALGEYFKNSNLQAEIKIMQSYKPDEFKSSLLKP